MAYEWRGGSDLGDTVRLILKLIGLEANRTIAGNGGSIMCIL